MSSSSGSFIPHWLKTTLRAGISIGLAAVLVMVTLKATGADLPALMGSSHKGFLMLGAGVHGAILLITMFRWYLLLRVQGINLSLPAVFRLTMIGFFFNLAVPGAVGGDLVKMAYIAKQTPGKRTESIFSILVDRIIGLLGLLIVASIAVLLSLKFLASLGQDYRSLQLAAYTVGLGSVAGIAGIIILELRKPLMRHPWIAQPVAWAEKKLPKGIVDTVVRVTEALELYRTNRATMTATIALSVIVHSLTATSLWCLGMAIGEQVLRLRDYFLTAQVANCIAAIPITPAGVGTRDAITAMFFKAMDASPDKAGAIPVILTLIILCWGLIGAVVFMLSPAAHHLKDEIKTDS